MRVAVGICVWMCVAAGELVAGGAPPIDLVLRRLPGGAVQTVSTDGRGVYRLSIENPGTYLLEARLRRGSEGVAAISMRAAFSGMMSGRAIDGNRLLAAGVAQPGQSLLFSETVSVTDAVRLSGEFYREPDVHLRTTHLRFSGIVNGPSPLPQVIEIAYAGSGKLEYEATAETLGTAFLVALKKVAGGIEVVPDTRGLGVGSYSAQVRMTLREGGATYDRTVGIGLNVLAAGGVPPIGLDRPMEAAIRSSGGAYPIVRFRVTNLDSVAQPLALALNDNSLTARLSPANMRLVPGETVEAALEILSAQTPGVRSVHVTLGRQPTSTTREFLVSVIDPGVNCVPSKLAPILTKLDATALSGAPLNFSTRVYDNCGNSYPDAVLRVHSPEQLLTVEAGAGSAFWRSTQDMPQLRITAEVGDPKGNGLLTGTVSVSLRRDGPEGLRLASEMALVSTASFEATSTSPGEIVSLFGNFPIGAAVSANTLPLPKKLGELEVRLDGKAIPLIYVSQGQVNGLIPLETSVGQHTLDLYRLGISGSIALEITEANPALFSADGLAHLYRANGSRVNRENPARSGETLVLYATGLGLVEGSVESGGAAPSEPLSKAKAQVKTKVGEAEARIVYAGLTPGSSGLYQVNLVVPEILAAQSEAGESIVLPLKLTVGDSGSSLAAQSFFVVNSRRDGTGFSMTSLPPGLVFQVNGISHTGGTGTQRVTAGQVIALDVANGPQSLAGTPDTRYTFQSWSMGGTKAQSFAVPQNGGDYTVQFAAQHRLRLTGTASLVPSSADGFHSALATVIVNGICASGTLGGIRVRSGGAASSQLYPSPVTLTMDGPKAVEVLCTNTAPMNYEVRVTTSPEACFPMSYRVDPDGPPLALRAAGNCTGYNLTLNSSSTYRFALLDQVLAAQPDTIYKVNGPRVSGEGAVPVEWASQFSDFLFKPSRNATYDFAYTRYHKLSLAAGQGGTIVSSIPGANIAEGSVMSLGGVCPAGQTFRRFDVETLTYPALAYTTAAPLTTNPSPFTLTKPSRINLVCGGGLVSHTISTDPFALRITVDNQPQLGPFQVNWAAGGNHTLRVTTPQLNTSNDTQYIFLGWSPSGTSSTVLEIAGSPTEPTVFTANFYPAAYRVTPLTTGNCTFTTIGGFYPANSSQTANVVIGSGAALTALTWRPSGGLPVALSNGGAFTVNGPGNLAATCTN